jgi:hypothetical protein
MTTMLFPADSILVHPLPDEIYPKKRAEYRGDRLRNMRLIIDIAFDG